MNKCKHSPGGLHKWEWEHGSECGDPGHLSCVNRTSNKYSDACHENIWQFDIADHVNELQNHKTIDTEQRTGEEGV